MECKDDYKQLQLLGSGGFGECYKIRRKRDQKILVWKVIHFNATNAEEFRAVKEEFSILSQIEHEHVVKYYGSIIETGERVSKAYLIMEYCGYGSLDTMIDKHMHNGLPIPERLIWAALNQIVSGLIACHTINLAGEVILHRDLKPANILLTSDLCFKISDFGCSRLLDTQDQAKTMTGTPYYMAPEVLNNEHYDEKCDIWSLGCLLYELCALRPPFVEEKGCSFYENIVNTPVPEIPSTYSCDLKDTIPPMLEKEPNYRPSTSDIEEHLRKFLWDAKGMPVEIPYRVYFRP